MQALLDRRLCGGGKGQPLRLLHRIYRGYCLKAFTSKASLYKKNNERHVAGNKAERCYMEAGDATRSLRTCRTVKNSSL